ncbi:10046_t:CDS:2, partial [Gigaspora margarita]
VSSELKDEVLKENTIEGENDQKASKLDYYKIAEENLEENVSSELKDEILKENT